jgi:hypothetical protein
MDAIRDAVFGETCQVFPVNILFLPLIYWLAVLTYLAATEGITEGPASILKKSLLLFFRNGFARHPSQIPAAIMGLAFIVLNLGCANYLHRF